MVNKFINDQSPLFCIVYVVSLDMIYQYSSLNVTVMSENVLISKFHLDVVICDAA